MFYNSGNFCFMLAVNVGKKKDENTKIINDQFNFF